MGVLIFSMFRTKIKLILSVLIFVLVFEVMMIVINSYIINSKKIGELKKTEVNTTINVILKNEDEIKKIESILHVSNIVQKDNISNDNYLLIVNVDDESNTDYVEQKILALGLDASKNKIVSPELEMYLEVDNFNKIFIGAIAIGLLILLFIEIKLQFVWENKNILLLKILGYEKKLIITIIISRVFIQVLLANIISIVTFLIFYTIKQYSYSLIVLILPLVFSVCVITSLLPLIYNGKKTI